MSRARNQRESQWHAYSLTLKMEVIYSSETLLDVERTMRRYIPKDRTLQNFKFLFEALCGSSINPYNIHGSLFQMKNFNFVLEKTTAHEKLHNTNSQIQDHSSSLLLLLLLLLLA
jgi:hypothetical protein